MNPSLVFNTLISLAGHSPQMREYPDFSTKMESTAVSTGDEQAREASGRKEAGSPGVWR